MSFRALIKICGTVAALTLAGAAHGQSTESPSTTTTGTVSDEQRAPQTLPACPPGEQTAAAPVVAPPPPAPPPPAPVATKERKRNKYFAPHEVSLTTGAGVANYFGGADSPDTVDPGAAWDARVTVGIHSPIALEAAYMGAVNNIDMGNGLGHGQLHSNGFDGDVRFQLPTRVQPYVFGGVGYNHMEVRNNGTGAAGNYVGKDDQVTVPAGGGVTAYVGKHVTVDARGTYRFIPDNGITVMTDRHLHQWLAQAHVGYAF